MGNDTAPRRMRCGCGFELVGDDATIEVFNEHVCTANTEFEPPTRWHESVFSGWGVVFLLILAILTEEIVSALVGAK